MNIVIAGDGEVGFHLARSLNELGFNITVVNPHTELLKSLEIETDLLTIAGDITSPAVLRDAGVASADLFLAVLHHESPNLLACAMARKLGAAKTVARISNAELLSPKHKEMMHELGVDELVCPERIAAKEITNLLDNSVATEFFSFGGLTMYAVRLESDSPVVGHSVRELSQTYASLQVKVVALLRQGETVIPHAETVLMQGDQAYIIGGANQVERVNRVAGKEAVSVRRVMIAGGGRVGRYAALTLQDRMRVTLIEHDRHRAEELAASLDKTLVVHGDATDIDLLKSEGLQEVDAFVAVTSSSETNVLTCLHAKRLGVRRTIALVENTGFITLSQDIGIDTIINKKLIAASYISRFIVKGSAVSSKWLSGTNAEVIEFEVGKWAPATRRKLGALSMPDGATIGGIIRGKSTMLPSRDLELRQGDRVVVFTLPKVMSRVARLFD